MRSPHHITAHPYANPYEQLGVLDEDPPVDGPLEEFLVEDTEHARDEAAAQDDPWAPPNHRKGSRRKRRGRLAGLPFAMKAVVGILVVAAFLTLADRWALLYAERRAADTLKTRLKLTAAPEVEIAGFPFLTQLADERLDSVKVTVPDVAADRISLAQVTATAKDVRLDTDGPASVRGADVPRLEGDVLLSFADLNRELGASQVTFTGEGRDRVRARGTLPVAGHDLRLRAEARIVRNGDRGIATHIGGMRLDIGDLATYRPGARTSEGLHLSRESVARLAHETRKAKALLSVPAVVRRLGVPDSLVREALANESKLTDLVGTPRFLRQAMRLNLIDLALDHPRLLALLGFDPALLDALPRLTRPVLTDQLSLGFRLPEPPSGRVRLRDVRVEKDGIRVRLEGADLAVGRP
ncbi:LmeA family phospholipid-binding protein [Streptomyces chartreusis]|uniref:LmeA family phospholipid-binding protein n=1 Tax=Streptomyces chartreusis TaxID=1969 RepID=UPI003652877B